MTVHGAGSETRRVKCPRRCARLSRGKWGAIGNGGVQRKVTLRSLNPAVRMARYGADRPEIVHVICVWRLQLGLCISNASGSDIRNSAYSRLYPRTDVRIGDTIAGPPCVACTLLQHLSNDSDAMITIHVQSWTSHPPLQVYGVSSPIPRSARRQKGSLSMPTRFLGRYP
jgi:hypothetical protein